VKRNLWALRVAWLLSIAAVGFPRPVHAADDDGGCDKTHTADAGCYGDPPPPRRKVIDSPARPTFATVEDLDYAALPLTKPRQLTTGPEESFKIDWEHYDSNVTPMAAPTQEIYFPPFDANLRIGDRAFIPAEKVGYGYGRLPSSGKADWFVVDDAASSFRSATVRRYEGSIEPPTKGPGWRNGSVATAESAETVRAVALVPGRLYAFRRCTKGCDGSLSSGDRREELGIVAPRAFWTSATDSLTDSERDPGGTAHVVRTAALAPGSSASLSVVLADVRTTPAPGKKSGRVTVDIDSVWVEGSEPTLTLYVGGLAAERDSASRRAVH
jgi:hypothetical protein